LPAPRFSKRKPVAENNGDENNIVENNRVEYNSEQKAAPEAKPIEHRAINKRIKDFPEKTDLSTPESALAACGRQIEKKNIKAAMELCWIKMDADTIRDIEDALKHAPDLPKDFNEQILDSKIIEVLTYKDDFAGVVVNSKALQGPYSVQYLGRIDGIWKYLDAPLLSGEYQTPQAPPRICKKYR